MAYLWGGMILVGIIYGIFTGNIREVTEAAVASSREAVELCIAMSGITAMWAGIMKIAEEAGLVKQLAARMEPVLRFLFPLLPEDSPARSCISLNFLSNILGLNWAATPAGLKAMEALAELEEERRAQEKGEGKWTQESAQGRTKTWQQEKSEGKWAQESAQGRAEARKQEKSEGKWTQESAQGWTGARKQEKGEGKWAQESAQGRTEAWRREKGEGKRAQGDAGRRGAPHLRCGRKIPAMPRGTASNEMCTFLILNVSSLQLIPVSVIAYRAQYGSVNPAAIVGPAILATAVSTAAAAGFCRVMERKRLAGNKQP